MTPKELEELMSDCAENAVKTAKDEFDVTLDFSKQSIANVDDLLLSFIDKYHDQALERADIRKKNKGKDVAQACLRMMEVKKMFHTVPQ